MPLSDDAARFLKLKAPSAKATIALTGFEGEEAMSQPFRFVLDMVADDPSLDMLKMVGQPVTFSAKITADESRHFHGKILRISAGAVETSEEGELRRFRADVVPSLWFLKFNQNCRIFQEKTTPQIIEQVYKDIGWTTKDYSLSLGAKYPKLEYCVQYNESDYQFVTRLMEEAGIFYYFHHGDTGHKMVMSDKSSGYVNTLEEQVEFSEWFERFEAGTITSWEHQLEFTAGKFSHTDYNFETPTAEMATKENTKVKTKGIGFYEVYEYPGVYLKTDDGKGTAKARIEELEWPHEIVSGESTCLGFSPGAKFKIKTHPVPGEKNKTYTLLSVRHQAYEPTLNLFGQSHEKKEYSNSFQCIPAAVVYRPPRVTPKPHTRGLQTAVVVGGKDDEILADKYGRIKVQFHWDREGKQDDKSSCWIRVAQTWAGNKRGSLFTPRVGDEVIVDFLEGDPDRPLVVGSLYNSKNMPPYPPDKKDYQSGIKTFSTKDGKAKNFNELLFEDKFGKEQIYFHAERDFVRLVENDDKLKVGFDVAEKGDQTIDIKNDRTVTIHEGNDTLNVDKGDHLITIEKGDQKIDINTGNQLVTVKGDQKVTVTSGNHKLHVKAGKSETEAATKIVLKVGGSSIEMTPSGITIKAAKIDVLADMNVMVKGGMAAKVEGGISASLKGGAMAEIKGGMVNIN